MTYAFLEPALGPEGNRGVMLYRITDSGQTPSIAWWPSSRAYFQGDEGIDVFDGATRDSVEAEYPNIAVFHDRHSAMEADALLRIYPKIMRMYLTAMDNMHESMRNGASYQYVFDDNQRGRHWLFGASEVTCGDESELAWLAHRVFI